MDEMTAIYQALCTNDNVKQANDLADELKQANLQPTVRMEATKVTGMVCIRVHVPASQINQARKIAGARWSVK